MPAPTPTLSTDMAGKSQDSCDRAVSSAMPVGVASSPSPPDSTRQPADISSTAGTGTGRAPWEAATRPEPTPTALQDTEVTPSQSSAAHTPTTFRDRVPASGLVEVHLVGRDPMHSRLGSGQPLEHAPGLLPYLQREIGMLKQALNVAPAAMRLILHRRVHVYLGRAHPGPRDQRGRQPDRLGYHGVHRALQDPEGRAGIDERREQHIPGHTRRRIHPGVPACTG